MVFLPRSDNACTVIVRSPVGVRQRSSGPVRPQPCVTFGTWAVDDAQLTLSYWLNGLPSFALRITSTNILHGPACLDFQSHLNI